jgi:hypothetical protein
MLSIRAKFRQLFQFVFSERPSSSDVAGKRPLRILCNLAIHMGALKSLFRF